MSLRNPLYLVVVAALCTGVPAFSQVNGIEVSGGATAQVLTKPPVVQVRDASDEIQASIPIDENPGKYVYSKANDTLYVVHNQKKGLHTLSAVNLAKKRVDQVIPIGAGEWVDMLVSDDGHRLYCFTESKQFSLSAERGMALVMPKGLEAPYAPEVRVIDTATNKVVATDVWFDDFNEGMPKHWMFGGQFLASTDDGKLIMATKAFWGKPIKDRLVVFKPQSSHPAFMIDPGGEVVASMLSKDEKTLFVAVLQPGKPPVGELIAVDLEKGTIAHHSLSDPPTKLIRLGSNKELWIADGPEMRALSESGELSDRRIQLNKPRKSEEGNEGASAFMNGQPGETISLGENRAAILIDNKAGGSQHRVALLDLKNLRVENIIPTMSEGEKARIRTGRILLAVALTAATGGNVIFIPNMGFRNEALAARPDGKFLYTLDLESHEVTVVDVESAGFVKRIPVDHSVVKLQVSSDGKQILCMPAVAGKGKVIQRIDFASNNLLN